MNLETLRIDPDIAKAKARRYARELRSERVKNLDVKYRVELEVLRRAYRELAKGTRILDINKAFQKAGLNDKAQPKLAIARADAERVKFTWHGRSTVIEFNCAQNLYGSRSARTMFRPVDMEVLHNQWRRAHDGTEFVATLEGYSAVPRVPLEHMPEGALLSKFYTLWEVEEWFKNERRTKVDPDPFLLKYLGGPFYAVIAEWELTELEMSLQNWMKQV